MVRIIVLLAMLGMPFAAQLGVNISLPERGGTFVDLVKENYRWSDNGTWASLTSDQVDSRGWPTVDCIYIADFRPVAEWSGSIDDPDAYRVDYSGTWKCSFTGQAAVTSSGGGSVANYTYSAGTNTSTFDWVVSGPPGAGDYMFMIRFASTQRTAGDTVGSGITDYKMIRPGYAADTDQIFTDDFISTLTDPGFSCIRFMPFLSTNGSEPAYPESTEWQERKQVTDASQAAIGTIGKKDGGAWEYVIALANEAQMDVWINIQLSATDDYVTRLAQLLKDSLDASLNIYVESSNEVWNTAPAFDQSTWNKLQAADLGIGEHQNHARRGVELSQLFAGVFGSAQINDRVRVVLCSHKPMLKWWVVPMLNYVRDTFGPPADYLYAIACQTYFGAGADSGESVNDILTECHDEITSQFDESGGTNEAGRLQWAAEAAKWELPGGFCSYEGGPDHGGGSTVNISNRITAERSAGMAAEMKYNLVDGWRDLNCNLAMQFTLTSAYTRYGCWGLTDDVGDPDRNYKFQAIREVITAMGTRVDGRIIPVPAAGVPARGMYTLEGTKITCPAVNGIYFESDGTSVIKRCTISAGR